MSTRLKRSLLGGIVGQLCPRCRSGKMFHYSIFRGFPKMYDRCAECGLKFEREEGYFLGAMYIAYAMALASVALIAVLLWVATSWPIVKIATWATLLFLPVSPVIALFARVLWIYLDQSFDPSPPER